MAVSFHTLHPHFAAEVGGIDIAAGVDDEDITVLRDGFETHSVLVFRDQILDDETQLAFSARFGPLETTLSGALGKGANKLSASVSDLSNIDGDGEVIPPEDERMVFMTGNRLWHTDSSFKTVPALASLLSGREVPREGGETEFCCLRAAYDTLDEATKTRIAGLIAEHSIVYSRRRLGRGFFSAEEAARIPPVHHPIVRANPVNGRRALYLGAHASHILDLDVDEGRALIDDLMAHATRPEYVYSHRWRWHDLVMWDNRAVLHRGRPWDEREPRVMHRTTVAGTGPTVGPDAHP